MKTLSVLVLATGDLDLLAPVKNAWHVRLSFLHTVYILIHSTKSPKRRRNLLRRSHLHLLTNNMSHVRHKVSLINKEK